jgi:fructose/tagatose bisphosphate aldolase
MYTCVWDNADTLTQSEEPVDENISTCVKYLKRMAPMKQWLEMEIGITV